MQDDVLTVIDYDGVQQEIGLGLAQFLLGHRGCAELEDDRFHRAPTQRLRCCTRPRLRLRRVRLPGR
ncbi:hypothetical protein [Streptomyces sp. NPDC020377]|uniref:hypothetical protein n=1 Tax=Streptomyces sp. NPDC020377 TaxID=3365070 RepID=UPI0037AC8E98